MKEIPRRTAMEFVSNFLGTIGALGGLAFIFIILAVSGISLPAMVGGILGATLIWASFAVYGELLQVFQNIEATKIEILNQLKDNK